MAALVNGNAQIVAYHFGHSQEVAMGHYIKEIPEDTAKASLGFQKLLTSVGQQGTENR
jgi:hypothetical protein